MAIKLALQETNDADDAGKSSAGPQPVHIACRAKFYAISTDKTGDLPPAGTGLEKEFENSLQMSTALRQ